MINWKEKKSLVKSDRRIFNSINIRVIILDNHRILFISVILI
jgi:hypothetical protein